MRMGVHIRNESTSAQSKEAWYQQILSPLVDTAHVYALIVSYRYLQFVLKLKKAKP